MKNLLLTSLCQKKPNMTNYFHITLVCGFHNLLIVTENPAHEPPRPIYLDQSGLVLLCFKCTYKLISMLLFWRYHHLSQKFNIMIYGKYFFLIDRCSITGVAPIPSRPGPTSSKSLFFFREYALHLNKFLIGHLVCVIFQEKYSDKNTNNQI